MISTEEQTAFKKNKNCRKQWLTEVHDDVNPDMTGQAADMPQVHPSCSNGVKGPADGGVDVGDPHGEQ